MSNLEDFLRQAAERRKQRERGGQQPSNVQKPLADRPPNMYQPQILQAELVIEPEIIEPEIVIDVSDRHLKSLKPTLPKTNRLAKEIDQADEKLEGRQKQVFDHQVGQLGKSKKPKSKAKPQTKRLSDNQPTLEIAVDKPGDEVLEMLRHPQSLRVAFIASEIFTRKHF